MPGRPCEECPEGYDHIPDPGRIGRAIDHGVVVLDSRSLGLVVALAELVIHQAAEFVAEIAAPEARRSLAELNDGRMVLRGSTYR